jgi:hypothetical protein
MMMTSTITYSEYETKKDRFIEVSTWESHLFCEQRLELVED